MARVLSIVGVSTTFVLFGAVAIGLAVHTFRHFTLGGVLASLVTVYALFFLWSGFRVIVLKRPE